MSNKPKAISKKFGRARDQRRALIKSLADSLILEESIQTTLPKAKVVARYTEKLISSAKKNKNSLHNRRLIISGLATKEAAHKIVDEIAPKLSGRNSGYFHIERLGWRRGDNAQMAKVSFVDDLKSAKKSQKTDKIQTTEEKPVTKKAEKPEIQPPQAVKDTTAKLAQPKMPAQAPKRAGVRGNR